MTFMKFKVINNSCELHSILNEASLMGILRIGYCIKASLSCLKAVCCSFPQIQGTESVSLVRGANNGTGPLYESPAEVAEAQEALHTTLALWDGPPNHHADLCWVHAHLSLAHNCLQVFHCLLLKGTLFRIQAGLVLPQCF